MGVVALVGRGVVGLRIERRLPLLCGDVEVVAVDTRRAAHASATLDRCDVAVLALPGPHAPLAHELLARGVHVVSIGDGFDDVAESIELHDLAVGSGASIVVGAGMCPGLSGLLVRHLADQLASIDEIHIALHGTAGPACARQHHRALAGRAVGLHDGDWIRRPAGSGRELCWFPEPVGAYDCYRGELPSPLLLRDVFPEVMRMSVRVSANRRDRLTAWLPMMSRPHREGGVGALRIEVRGTDRRGGRSTLIAGIAELVGTAAAATAAAFTQTALAGSLPAGVVRAGDAQLETAALLRAVERGGVRLQEFTGVPHQPGQEEAA
ncbi:MAG: hypothetical protein ABWZ42_10470 [Ilumatobacteraceae bacterium]